MIQQKRIKTWLPFLIVLIGLGAVAWIAVSPLLAATGQAASACTVDDDGPADYSSIQTAVNDTACNPINIAAGTYYETVVVTRSVAIHGAGLSQTFVSGQNADSVFTFGLKGGSLPATATSELSGMTIQAGAAAQGGGIYNGFKNQLTGENLFITSNGADSGGGIYNSGMLTITNVSVTANFAAQGGGGIRSSGNLVTNLIINHSNISDNYTTGTGGGLNVNSLVTIADSLIARNNAEQNAGGMWAGTGNTNSPPMAISGSVIRENRSGATAGVLIETRMTIHNSRIISNTGGFDQVGSRFLRGGGLRVAVTGVLTLTNSLVSGNTMIPILNTNSGYGGGIDVSYQAGGLTMVNTTVANNEPDGVAVSQDGFVTPSSVMVDIQNSQITDNVGIGINQSEGTVLVTNSRIQDNSLGGIHGNTVDLSYTTISNNGRYGVYGHNVSLAYSAIYGHSGPSDGGGIAGLNLDILSSAIYNNHSDANGGGIQASGVLTVVNSTISGNSANGNGGGIALTGSNGAAYLDSVTVAYNTADIDADGAGDGGGIFRDDASGPFSLQNSLIANNQDDSALNVSQHPDCSGDFTSVRSNLIGDYDGAYCTGFGSVFDRRNMDPLLQPLYNSGGPTPTHALNPASPAVDWRNECPAVDQRGVTRPQDGGSGNNLCDIGAYEIGVCPTPVEPVLSITNDDNDIQLSWAANANNHAVEVLRGPDSYKFFTLTQLYKNYSRSTDYTDINAIGDPATDNFYRARGWNACGSSTTYSNRVGEIDLRIKSGGNGRYLRLSLISVPLDGYVPATADDLAAYIDPDGSVKKVARWNRLTNTWIIRTVGLPPGLGGTPDFPVSLGDVLMVAADSKAPNSFAWVGDVPTVGAVQYNLQANEANFISIPFNQSGNFTMDAEGLANDIGSVVAVAKWDRAGQGWIVRQVGVGGPNFAVRLGRPYVVITGNNPPAVWP